MAGELPSWNDGAARQAIVEFVERDGVGRRAASRSAWRCSTTTARLWCEKPMPIQADFILRRLFEMAQADPDLRGRQPWKAAYERDYALARRRCSPSTTRATTRTCGRSWPASSPRYGGISVEEFEAKSDAFLRTDAASDPRPRLPASARMCRWSSCSATWKRTGSRTTSPPAAAATSCGRSARRCTASRATG